MDFQFPSFPIFFAFLVFVFTVLRLAKRSKTDSQIPNLPPGPRKLPLIGNMHKFVGSLPHHCLRDLAKKHGPLMHLQLGELPILVVSSPEAAKEVMKTHDAVFATRPYLLATDIFNYHSTDIAFAPYGDYWRQLRKICVFELLSAKRVQSFKSIREEEVSNLIKFIAKSTGSLINLSEKIFALTNSVITRAAIGKKSEDQGALIRLIKESTALASGFYIGDLFPSVKIIPIISGQKSKLERVHRETDRILDSIIDEHKARKAGVRTGDGKADEDLLDVLLRVQGNGELEHPFSTDNIKAVILDIFGAGTETTSSTIVWAMSQMLKNQRVMEEAQAEVRQVFNRKGTVNEAELHELKYLKLVIKETLRLHPSAPLLVPRECRERCEIDGYEIPAKTKVIVNAWAIGRHSEYWSDAESFIPERFLDNSVEYKGTHFEFIPFGAGRRMCPGISFALANVELSLAQLLYHFDWKLPNGTKNEELDMTEAFGSTILRKSDLCAIASAYRPLPF